MEFIAGDKIYKIINNSIDTSSLFVIETVIKKEIVSWCNDHHIYVEATLIGEIQPYILSCSIYGYAHSKEVYAEKIIN